LYSDFEEVIKTFFPKMSKETLEWFLYEFMISKSSFLKNIMDAKIHCEGNLVQ
jgi:hypothetical protein